MSLNSPLDLQIFLLKLQATFFYYQLIFKVQLSLSSDVIYETRMLYSLITDCCDIALVLEICFPPPSKFSPLKVEGGERVDCSKALSQFSNDLKYYQKYRNLEEEISTFLFIVFQLSCYFSTTFIKAYFSLKYYCFSFTESMKESELIRLEHMQIIHSKFLKTLMQNYKTKGEGDLYKYKC